MIAGLICQSINKIRSNNIKARIASNDTITVKYYLTLPKWAKDNELITSPNHTILYSRYTGKGKMKVSPFIVNESNKNVKEYPQVGISKWLVIDRQYKIVDWLSIDYLAFVKEERRKIFREIQSNIALEKIGMATREWEAITEGKYKPYVGAYADNKISWVVSNSTNGWGSTVSLSSLSVLPPIIKTVYGTPSKQEKEELLKMFEGDNDCKEIANTMCKKYLQLYPNEKHFKKRYLNVSRDYRKSKQFNFIWYNDSLGGLTTQNHLGSFTSPSMKNLMKYAQINYKL